MILIVTNKLDPTTDLVVTELHRRKVAFARFNTEDFPTKVHCSASISDSQALSAYLDLGRDRQVRLVDIHSVYYRRPKPPGIDPQLSGQEVREFALQESQAAINGLWMTLPCLWVNHPHLIRAADFKIEQLRLATQLGLPIPKTLITNDPCKVREFFDQCEGNIVAKVLRTGIIEYDDKFALIYTTRLLNTHLELLHTVQYAPCLFQEYVPKRIEIRVTIVGDRVFAAEIHSQSSARTKDDWRRYDFPNTPYFPHTLPVEIEMRCKGLLDRLGLNFAAIDLILKPDGRYVFLELNPNGQWGWIEELTHLPICSAIVDLLLQGKAKFSRETISKPRACANE